VNLGVEINKTGDNNVEVAVQLQDVTGARSARSRWTFPYVAGTDQEALVKKARRFATGCAGVSRTAPRTS